MAYESPGITAEDFMDNPVALRRTLEDYGTFHFNAYPSGLFPASDLPPDLAQATRMDMAWLRDNGYLGGVLYESGHRELAVPVGRAMLTVLGNNSDTLDGIASGAIDPRDKSQRLPVRVDGTTLENDTEKRVQNDSVGHTLWLTSRLIRDQALRPGSGDVDILAQTVRYLDKIAYWQDEDEGHWEEDRAIHASSIGAVVAGLRGAQAMFESIDYRHKLDMDTIIGKGVERLNTLLPHESPNGQRTHDAALLFLVEPLRVVRGGAAATIVMRSTDHLMREKGFARYDGDTYWAPRFSSLFSIEERTTSAEGRLEKRNQMAEEVRRSRTEAQWTIFDPVIQAYFGEQYMFGDRNGARERQLHHLNRSLSQLVVAKDGRWLMPELYYQQQAGEDIWGPNDHTPLLWAQANLLRSLQIFEDTTR